MSVKIDPTALSLIFLDKTKKRQFWFKSRAARWEFFGAHQRPDKKEDQLTVSPSIFRWFSIFSHLYVHRTSSKKFIFLEKNLFPDLCLLFLAGQLAFWLKRLLFFVACWTKKLIQNCAKAQKQLLHVESNWVWYIYFYKRGPLESLSGPLIKPSYAALPAWKKSALHFELYNGDGFMKRFFFKKKKKTGYDIIFLINCCAKSGFEFLFSPIFYFYVLLNLLNFPSFRPCNFPYHLPYTDEIIPRLFFSPAWAKWGPIVVVVGPKEDSECGSLFSRKKEKKKYIWESTCWSVF